jgi:hypothetical protein
MEQMQGYLKKTKSKGFPAFLIYTGIFIFMALTVTLKFAGNLFHIKKAKLK